MTDEKLTDDPRSPDEVLEDEARAIKDEPPGKDPEAADFPEDVKTEPIDNGDGEAASDDDGSTHDHKEDE